MLDRRDFLKTLSIPLFTPLAPLAAQPRPDCWLEVIVPFLAHDPAQNWSSSLLMPSATFAGRGGFLDRSSGSDYEILGYRADGSALKAAEQRLALAPMQTTLLDCSQLFPTEEAFWGAARIRILPRVDGIPHHPDLFSAAYVRWDLEGRFSNLHANPHPPQLQRGQYYAAMPFPPVVSERPLLSLFNPQPGTSRGEIRLFDPDGAVIERSPYEIESYHSRLWDLSTGKFSDDAALLWKHPKEGAGTKRLARGGSILISNRPDTPKLFAFLLLHDRGRALVTEHPIYQGGYEILPATAQPFDAAGRFRPVGFYFCPLFFSGWKSRGLTFSSRVHFGVGRPPEDPQWMQPFACGGEGQIVWTTVQDADFQKRESARMEKGLLRLRPYQSVTLDARELPLPGEFPGGLAVATAPATNHTLMKIEVDVAEWGLRTLSHFRPGSASSRKLKALAGRDSLISDYIVSGVRLERKDGEQRWDSLLAIMNIEFEEHEGRPVLQLFDRGRLLAGRALPAMPPLACRHYWASELFPGAESAGDRVFSIRLLDDSAVVVVSALHVDFKRRQLAIDHGSDRFSTFLDYSCSATKY